MPPAMQRFLLARIRNRTSLASERGSFLVEVMVGAIVLAITTTAVLSGLDGAQDTGRRNKDRSELSTLAQQDLERLRSIPITSLSNYDETRTVRVATVDYTVHSTTEWVRDASGVVSRTDDNTQAEYMKVSSTVTSPASINNPVTETTLLTPAPGAFSATAGTAAVLVTDRLGNPRAGVNVALNGTASFSDTTNSLGCAVFGYIPSGAYTATISNMVAWVSTLPATSFATVAPGRTALVRMEVEPPASLSARFRTPGDLAVVGPDGNAGWNKLSIVHSKLGGGGIRFIPSLTATSKAASFPATELFPHNDAYGVYAGTCASNNPASTVPSYFKPPNGTNGYIQLDPGDAGENVDVKMAALVIPFTKRAAAPRFGIRIKQIDTGCVEDRWNHSELSVATSKTFTFPLPFGTYKICVYDGAVTGQRHRVSSATTVLPAGSDTNTNTMSQHQLTPATPAPSVTHSDTVNLNTTGTSAGACPASF